jgi:processive 1,2-diacylglycerol beta-glucosyltransferase
MPQKIIILTSGGGQGLISGSQAIKEGLEQVLGNRVEVSIIDFLKRTQATGQTLTRFYNFLLRKSLYLNTLFLKVVHILRTDKWTFLYKPLAKALEEILEREKPDALIITTQYIVAFMSHYKNKHQLKTKVLVGNIDPGTSCLPLWFGKHIDKHIIPTAECMQAFIKAGFKEDQAIEAKLVVRDGFKKISLVDRNDVRAKLDLDPEAFIVLFSGSREGYEGVLPIVKKVCQDTSADCVVICGKNECLKSKLLDLKNRNDYQQLTVVGWTDDVHEYMRAADLVIAKPGKQTMKESIATHTPMISICYPAIMEQEKGNLEVMKNREILLAAKRKGDVVALINRFSQDADFYQAFSEKVKKAAQEIDSKYVALLLEEMLGDI